MSPESSNTDPCERFARQVTTTLVEAGHIAYFAGGCVRDQLAGRKPKDFDVATNATPDRIREIFGRRRTLAIGAAFGVITVLGDSKQNQLPIEVATFRNDESYTDGRRPDSVVFSTPEEDAQRRDFTINGLFYDPLRDEVIDYVGGSEDLEAGIIRAIGDPIARIDEDKLRMLRAVRFAATLGFEIEPSTMAAIRHHSADISVVSGERIGAEMRRVLGCGSAGNGMELLISTGLSATVFPELVDANEKELLRLLAARPKPEFVSGLAAAVVAIERGGGDAAGTISGLGGRWRLSNEETARIRFSISNFERIIESPQRPWSEIQPVLAAKHAMDAISLADAVTRADDVKRDGVDFAYERLTWDRTRLDPVPLVTGETLRQLEIPSGPLYREILEDVRQQQLDEELETEASAIEYIRMRYS